MNKRLAGALVGLLSIGALAGGQAEAAGTPGLGVGKLINVQQTSATTMTVGAVRLKGVLAVAGAPRVIQVQTGSFSGTFYPCETPTCIAAGIVGDTIFDSTPVALGGTGSPGGAVSGTCQGGGLELIADGEVFTTRCRVIVAGKTSDLFDVYVDTPLAGNTSQGTFCATQSLPVSPVCEFSETVSGLIPVA